MSENEALYEKAMEAIMELYSDTSVSRAEAKVNLKSLMDEIRILLETLEGED